MIKKSFVVALTAIFSLTFSLAQAAGLDTTGVEPSVVVQHAAPAHGAKSKHKHVAKKSKRQPHHQAHKARHKARRAF